MKLTKYIIGATLAITPLANAQEAVLKLSVNNPTFRIEYGMTALKADDIFNIKWADFTLWTGAGATVTEGNLSGSFAALWEVPNFSKQLSLKIGPEYRAIQSEKPKFDFVINLSINKNQTIAVSTQQLMFVTKF